MATQLSLTPNANGTVFGHRAAIDEMRAVVYDHPELFPRKHTPDYFRKQLRGERDMTLEAFEATCDKLVRRFGNVGVEMVTAIFEAWLSRWKGDGAAPLQKSIEDEILESQVALAHLDIAVNDARTTGDVRKRRDAKCAASRAIKEIRDVVAHPAMKVSA